MTESFLIVLLLGTAAMLAVMLYGQHGIPVRKLVLSALFLTGAGTFGAYTMFRIENGYWGGQSFYGAVFFAPLIMALAAILLRIRVTDVLDLCAPAECVMLALLKLNCFRNECCVGRVLFTMDGTEIRFPSQIVEFLSSLAIMIILILLIRKERYRGEIYPFYMLVYGATRFVWNCLRETTPFIGTLPAGHFWSLLSVAIGSIWLFTAGRKKKNHIAHSYST